MSVFLSDTGVRGHGILLEIQSEIWLKSTPKFEGSRKY